MKRHFLAVFESLPISRIIMLQSTIVLLYTQVT